jgi:hypothetical protein
MQQSLCEQEKLPVASKAVCRMGEHTRSERLRA